MLAVVAVTGAAVVVAAPAAYANMPEGATVTVSPSMDLSDSSATVVNVDGEELYPYTGVQIDQCVIKQHNDCDVLQNDMTDANGSFNDDVDVNYTISDGSTCDSSPDGSEMCEIKVLYTSGQEQAQLAASAPLTFAGHDGTAPTLAFDPNGQPVDTKVNKDMQGSDGQVASVVVDAENADGSIDTNFTGAVTISFSQPNNADFVSGKPAVHTSSLTVDAVDGVANFSPIVIDTVGFGDTLVANADGLAQSAPSASFDVTSALKVCPAGQSCTVRATSPETGQSATVKALGGSGTPGTVVTASFGGNVTTLHGCSETADGILTFNGNRVKVIRLTVATTTYIGTFCWGQPDPFIDQTGNETTYFSTANQEYEGVLGFCSGSTIPPPCINSITVHGTSETVKATGGADDPRMSH